MTEQDFYKMDSPDTCPRCGEKMFSTWSNRYACPECLLHLRVMPRFDEHGIIKTPTEWRGYRVD